MILTATKIKVEELLSGNTFLPAGMLGQKPVAYKLQFQSVPSIMLAKFYLKSVSCFVSFGIFQYTFVYLSKPCEGWEPPELES